MSSSTVDGCTHAQASAELHPKGITESSEKQEDDPPPSLRSTCHPQKQQGAIPTLRAPYSRRPRLGSSFPLTFADAGDLTGGDGTGRLGRIGGNMDVR